MQKSIFGPLFVGICSPALMGHPSMPSQLKLMTIHVPTPSSRGQDERSRTYLVNGDQAAKGYGRPSCSQSAEQGKSDFSCPRSLLRDWSRELVSAILPSVSLLILHAQAQSGAYFLLRPLSDYPAPWERALKVARLTGTGCLGNTVDQLFCTPLSQLPLLAHQTCVQRKQILEVFLHPHVTSSGNHEFLCRQDLA